MANSESFTKQLTPFGAPMLKHFLLTPQYKNMNHGSFGTYPRAIQSVQRHYQDLAESFPDAFIRWLEPVELDKSRAAIAALLNVPRSECVFVQNASTGINVVLRNLVYEPNDVLVYLATGYGAIEKTIISLTETTPTLTAVRVGYEMPLGHGELVRTFRETIRRIKNEEVEEGTADDGKTQKKKKKKKKKRVKAAVFDTVASMPGVRLPFEELVEVCREEGVLSVIDGAHAVGQIKLDLGALQPDFFVSNCHKWLFTPRGCAVLYVATRNQDLIRTTYPTSWGFVPSPNSPATAASPLPDSDGKSAFEKLFQFVATVDNSPYFCVPAAIKWRKDVCGGEEAIYNYLHTLAVEGGDAIAKILNTEPMQEPDCQDGKLSPLRNCSMTTVRLPLTYSTDEKDKRRSPYEPIPEEDVDKLVQWMGAAIVKRYNTFLPVFGYAGWLWTRVSAQIYLEIKDFEWAGEVLKTVCEDVGSEQKRRKVLNQPNEVVEVLGRSKL